MENIVLNIPHSSVTGIFDAYGKWPRNPHFINDCVNKWTDWYTDFLFATTNEKVTSVIFPLSRFVCDVERLDNDPLEAEGQGILYRNFGGYSRGILSRTESQHLLDMRSRHLERMKSLLTPGSLLIDCHSFPAELYDCDICIGFNDDQSYDSGLVGLVKNKFEEMHYAVSLNAPYSNSITPPTGFAYKSIMIEVNKRIYLEKSGMLNPNSCQWMRWYVCMNRIYNAVLNYGND